MLKVLQGISIFDSIIAGKDVLITGLEARGYVETSNRGLTTFHKVSGQPQLVIGII